MLKKIILLITFCISLVFISCESMAPMGKIILNEAGDAVTIERTSDKPAASVNFPFKDITPASLSIPLVKVNPVKSEESEEYRTSLKQAIELMNRENYAAAADILKKMIIEYKDGGRCLYNLGLCYYRLKERNLALSHFATAYTLGQRNSNDMLGHICFEIGYEHLQNKNWVEAIRYMKIAPAITATSQNILYCYLELKETLPTDRQVVMMLYAGRYAIENGLRSENLVGLGRSLGKQLEDEPSSPYLADAIMILKYVTGVKNDPYVHKALGMLYLSANEPDKAEAEFRAAAGAGGSEKELVEFAEHRLVELKPVQYNYVRECPVMIKSGNAEGFKIIYSLPQNTMDQTVSDIQVSVNNNRAAFEIVQDRNDVAFLKLNPEKLLREGDNKVVITARVVRSPRRPARDALAKVKKSDYDTASAEYKRHTASDSVINVWHPLVQTARAELGGLVYQDNVGAIARGVYDWVVGKMSYQLYDQEKRPRTEILNRLLHNNCSGVCEDYAVLTVAILRSFGIPCSDLAGPMYKSDIGHAWPAIWLPGFKEFVVIDTTWGDTSKLPNFYFLYNTNLTVIDRIQQDSDILPDGQSSMYYTPPNVRVEIKKEITSITK